MTAMTEEQRTGFPLQRPWGPAVSENDYRRWPGLQTVWCISGINLSDKHPYDGARALLTRSYPIGCAVYDAIDTMEDHEIVVQVLILGDTWGDLWLAAERWYKHDCTIFDGDIGYQAGWLSHKYIEGFDWVEPEREVPTLELRTGS